MRLDTDWLFLCSMDVEHPVDVDDEYWDVPSPDAARASSEGYSDGSIRATPAGSDHGAFRQPPGRPSRVRAFILWLGLTEITAEIIKKLVRHCAARDVSASELTFLVNL